MIRILLAFIIISLPIKAQFPETTSQVRQHEIAKIFKELKAINEGVLLVRLKTNSRKIQALHKALRHKDAQQEELKQNQLNKEIVRSFKRYYSNSKVYFFFSFNSNLVLGKNFSVPFFLNDSLKIDSTIILDNNTDFIIAEFSSNKPRSRTPLIDSANGRKDTSTSSDVSALRFSALRLMNDRFEQLNKYLPRYVRTYQTIPFLRRSVEKSVQRLDAKLKVK